MECAFLYTNDMVFSLAWKKSSNPTNLRFHTWYFFHPRHLNPWSSHKFTMAWWRVYPISQASVEAASRHLDRFQFLDRHLDFCGHHGHEEKFIDFLRGHRHDLKTQKGHTAHIRNEPAIKILFSMFPPFSSFLLFFLVWLFFYLSSFSLLIHHSSPLLRHPCHQSPRLSRIPASATAFKIKSTMDVVRASHWTPENNRAQANENRTLIGHIHEISGIWSGESHKYQ